MTTGLEYLDIIINIGQILGITTSVVTVSIIYVIERKALIEHRKFLWYALLLLWSGIFLIIIDLILRFLFEYINAFAIVGIIYWLVGIIIFMRIFHQMCYLETITFSNIDDISEFNKFEPRFRVECIDSVIEQAKKYDIDLHFPVILAADEGWRPWNIGLNLANDALEKEAAVIFFTFTRPASMICDQLKNNFEKFESTTEIMSDNIKMGENLIIIDCFTPIAIKSKKDKLKKGVLFADPRNPHQLNKKYNRALKHLHKNKNKLVVIYDSISEFLFFSDIELATQFLRNNIVWEEEQNINSLYIVRLNTLEKSLEEYILWFANVVIYLKTENQMPLMKIRGLFKDPRNYDIQYNYKLKENNLNYK